MDRRRLLAVFAHPDDETFLAGGTLANCAAHGWTVRLISATRGEAGRRGIYDGLSQDAFADVRAAELGAACEALGIPPPVFLDCRDGEVNATAQRAQMAVADMLRKVTPDVVLTFGPDGVSGHPDHVAVHRLVAAAFHEWRNQATPYHAATLYYILRNAFVPLCCAPRGPEPAPPVTTIIALGAAGSRKLAAVRCHRSQAHIQPVGDEATIARLVASPEQFHRAWPPFVGALGFVEPELVANTAASIA